MNTGSSQFSLVSSDRPMSFNRRNLIIGVIVCTLAISLGVIIGYFSHGSCIDIPYCPHSGPSVPDSIIKHTDETIFQKIHDRINADNIRENLRKWTEYSHMAGTEGDDRLTQDVYQTWIDQGMEHVTTSTYDVLLSFPNYTDPSLIYILDENGKVNFTTQAREKPLEPSQNKSDVTLPFNAYSNKGNAQGPLVFVNYARIEDFRLLQMNYSIDFNGTIVIAKYGKIFRGTKVQLAESFGAVGVILYSDPADFVNPNIAPYPDSWGLPSTGVERGSVFSSDGDPLTPGYPATKSAYRYAENKTLLPSIPVHPIGYGDAQQFLMRLSGSEAPTQWHGGLNITYRIGPGLVNEGWSVKMHVTTYNRRHNTSNVIAYITGSVEPDRYVVLGNHRDAWVVGAIDPTSGTAVMMEISRVLAQLISQGWRPRRTIMFASWGAEEFALIGSYEWVEQYVKILSERCVAYLNVDFAFSGNDSIAAHGVPLLYDVLYTVAQRIETPNTAGKTLYDEWLEYYPDINTGHPRVKQLGSGSDFASFISFAGIPSLDVYYRYGPKYDIAHYPLYHTAYETYSLVSKYIDPEFKYSQAIGRFWLEAARYLADSYILPLNVSTYPEALHVYVQDLEEGYGEQMKANGITLDDLYTAVEKFSSSCKQFQKRLSAANRNNPVEIRMYNDQLMQLERAFLDPAGLPLRPLYKHVVFAPSTYNSYASATFPGLVDIMYEIDLAEDPQQ